MRPSAKDKGAFDLSFADDGGRYAYSGSRNCGGAGKGDNNYVLVFDPARKVFVLHRVDSVFNMNLTRTPDNTDADSLRDEYPQLGSSIKVHVEPKKESTTAARSAKPAREAKIRKEKDKAKETAAVSLTLPGPEPAPEPAKQPPPPPPAPSKRRAPEPEESEEDDDDDGGLTVEYPEGPPPPRQSRPADFSPAFPPAQIRRFSDFVQHADDDDDDADIEIDDDMLEEGDDEDAKVPSFNLGSPVNNPPPPAQGEDGGDRMGGEGEGHDYDGLEDDLEAELEKEFEAAASESDISEED